MSFRSNFMWSLWVQILLIFAAMLSHAVNPYVRWTDNLLEQTTFLLLACVLSAVKANESDGDMSYADWATVAISAATFVVIVIVLAISTKRRMRRRGLIAERDPSERRDQSPTSPTNDEELCIIAAEDAAEFAVPLTGLRQTRLWYDPKARPTTLCKQLCSTCRTSGVGLILVVAKQNHGYSSKIYVVQSCIAL